MTRKRRAAARLAAAIMAGMLAFSVAACGDDNDVDDAETELEQEAEEAEQELEAEEEELEQEAEEAEQELEEEVP